MSVAGAAEVSVTVESGQGEMAPVLGDPAAKVAPVPVDPAGAVAPVPVDPAGAVAPVPVDPAGAVAPVPVVTADKVAPVPVDPAGGAARLVAGAGGRFRLGARMRRVVLTVHVVVSVAWIGVDACLLALGLIGVLSRDPDLRHAVYLVVGRIGTYFIAPASLGALLTGLVLGVGTKWGLVRYRWVAIKLAMGVVLTVGGNLVILWRLRDAASQVAGGVAPAAVGARYVVIGSSAAGTALLIAATVLSIYKPWGRTRWGRRPVPGTT